MASASSSMIAQGAPRASVGRHATLQPVSSLRVKPFTTVKYAKSRGNANPIVGVRNAPTSRSTQHQLRAAETDAVVDDEELPIAADEDEVEGEYDMGAEEYETEEAEAVLELSEEQLGDRAFLVKQIGQLSDEASGQVLSTAEEETAQADAEEGARRLVDAIMQFEKQAQKAEAANAGLRGDDDEDNTPGENPLPFSDEFFYNEVTKNVAEIEQFSEDAVDLAARDPVQELLVQAATDLGREPTTPYPADLLDPVEALEVDPVEYTADEQAVLDALHAMPTPDIVLPNGVRDALDLALEYQPLTDEEAAALDAAEPATELSANLRSGFAQAVDIAKSAMGVPSKTDLAASGLHIVGRLQAAAAEGGADVAARAREALDSARAEGSISDAEHAELSAVAAEFEAEGVQLPEGLFEALGEKLDEVDALETVLEEEAVDATPEELALEAQVAQLLEGAGSVPALAGAEALLASLQLPEGPSAPGAAIFEQGRAMLGDEAFAQLLEEAVVATKDPAQVAAAKQWFLQEAQGVASERDLAALSILLEEKPVREELAEVEVPDVDTAALDALLDAPETQEAADKAWAEGVAAMPLVVVDASNYILDDQHPVLLEYHRLKAELLAAKGIDLDAYAKRSYPEDPALLEVVARILMNAAEGRDLDTGLDEVVLPEAPPLAAPPAQLSPELAAVKAQLEAVWAELDLSTPEPEAEPLTPPVDVFVRSEGDAVEFDATAGFVPRPVDVPEEADAVVAPAPVAGEWDSAVEARWLDASEEDWAATLQAADSATEVIEDVDPQAALVRAEAALAQLQAGGGGAELSEADNEALQAVLTNIAAAKASLDPVAAKLKQAAIMTELAAERTQLLEAAMASVGLFPDVLVPANMTRDEAAEFVQAYGGQVLASLRAAEERAEAGVHVRSLVEALAAPGAPAEAIDVDAVEADVRSLAASLLSPEEVAAIEANTPAAEADVPEPEEESEEVLAEKYTASELLDMRAQKAAAAEAGLPKEALDAISSTATPEEQISSLLAELGVTSEPAAEEEDDEEAADGAVAGVEAADEGEADELAVAFAELLADIKEEVAEAEDAAAEYVEDAEMYQAGVEEMDDEEDEEAADEAAEDGFAYDEAEANSLLEEVLEEYAQQPAEALPVDAAAASSAAADIESALADDQDDGDDGEAELQTIYNTPETQLLFDDYEDVWDAMGIPEARPKVPAMPRAKEDSDEGEEGEEVEEYVEEEEEGAAIEEEEEADVADVIAKYYEADALDDEVDTEDASSSAPRSTADLFGSQPYLEADEDRAADDASGLLERVTVSKTGDIFIERVIQVTRVTKVVKGGKIMSFRCVAIVGNRNGIVGVGVGSAREVVQAVQKACGDAKSSLIAVPLTRFDSTPHRVEAIFKGTKVVINPAADGTGCIAGGAVRSVLELAGVKNCLSKRIGSRNPLNNARATVKALEGLQTWGEVAAKRGLPMQYLFARDEETAKRALAAAQEE